MIARSQTVVFLNDFASTEMGIHQASTFFYQQGGIGMIEWDLLDEKDDRVYLAYMTNRQDPFVMFERDFGQMMDRAFKEIHEGYTHLWAMKRVGVI